MVTQVNTRFKIKRGDTAPAWKGQCLDGTTPVNLTGAVAVLVVRAAGVSRRLALVVEPGADGWVRRDWEAADTAATGLLQAEVEVTFSDGRKQTFPAEGYVTIEVVEDLG